MSIGSTTFARRERAYMRGFEDSTANHARHAAELRPELRRSYLAGYSAGVTARDLAWREAARIAREWDHRPPRECPADASSVAVPPRIGVVVAPMGSAP